MWKFKNESELNWARRDAELRTYQQEWRAGLQTHRQEWWANGEAVTDFGFTAQRNEQCILTSGFRATGPDEIMGVGDAL